MDMFQANWRTIRAEQEALLRDRPVLDIHKGGDRIQYVEAVRKDNGWLPWVQAGSDEPNYDWLIYGLCFQGMFPDKAEEEFPGTASLLRRIAPRLGVASFSLMRGPSCLLPHCHPELRDRMLIYHLGLTVPGNCYLNVSGRFIQEEEAKPIVFDGSVEHFAINMSRMDRVVLYMEFC